MQIELIDPTAELDAGTQEVAPSLSALSGKVVAGIDNGKWNAPELIDSIIAALALEHGMTAGEHHSKLQYNIELDTEVRHSIAQSAHCAILAVGD